MLEKVRKGIAGLLHALPAEGRRLLEESDVMLKRSVEEMKALSSDLYPDLLEKQGLMAALRGYTETFSKLTGVSVQIKAPTALKRSSIGIDLLIYRIAQEAFCNVSKHANAKVVIFSIDRKETHWQMSITDDGKGFDTRRYFASSPMKRKGMGILGMKGRVEMLGGTFYIESEPQHGTRVSVKIPVTTKEVL